MKKVICLMILLVSLSAPGFADTQKDLFETGVRLFKQGHYQKAVERFSQLIQLAPDHADAYKNRGVSYMKLEKFDLAIQDFETAKTLFPELKGLYSNLGVAWYYKKDYEKAIESYDTEIQMDSENHVAYFNRALCLAELGRNTDALDDLSRTLALKPEFYWALCYKADLLALSGQDIQAIKAYEAAIRQDPEDTYAREKRVQLKQKMGTKESPDLPKPPLGNPKEDPLQYTLQAGAFLNPTNADKMNTRLRDNGFDARILTLKGAKNKTWYLVRSGHYATKDAAHKAAEMLMQTLAVTSVVRTRDSW
ncbi:tetratricopeptide repeat protein [Desulfobacula sp.]|uniref:SPOR domain-containing protein n=1 Tax=Desulfobacula sp. TaxID=2593537 RepID=UPI00260D6BFD|nr:tetratricopeptide repeat protein [Desulfobacula sp.]